MVDLNTQEIACVAGSLTVAFPLGVFALVTLSMWPVSVGHEWICGTDRKSWGTACEKVNTMKNAVIYGLFFIGGAVCAGVLYERKILAFKLV